MVKRMSTIIVMFADGMAECTREANSRVAEVTLVLTSLGKDAAQVDQVAETLDNGIFPGPQQGAGIRRFGSGSKSIYQGISSKSKLKL